MSIQGNINSVLSAETAVMFGKGITKKITNVGSQMQDIQGISRDQERIQKEKLKQDVATRIQNFTPEQKQRIIEGVKGFTAETIWQRINKLREGAI